MAVESSAPVTPAPQPTVPSVPVAHMPPARKPIDWARTRDILISVIAAGIIIDGLSLLVRNVLTTVLVFIIAVFVAFAVEPLVGIIARQRVPRGLAIAIVYLGLLLLFLFGGYWLGAQLLGQLTVLRDDLPKYTADVQQLLTGTQTWLSDHSINVDLKTELTNLTSSIESAVTAAVGQSLKIVSGITAALVSTVLVIFFSIYLVSDAPRISKALPGIVPERYRRHLAFVQSEVVEKVGGFIRGQILMALIVGITTGVMAWVLGMQFPFVIGVLGFFFELIPSVGPILIGITLGILAAFQGIPTLIAVLIFYVALHMLESNVLGPRIVGHAVGLPPLVSLLAISAGAEVGGVLGALFAVPATALLMSLASVIIDFWKAESALGPESEPVDRGP